MRILDIKTTLDEKYIMLRATCQISHFKTDEVYFKFDKKFQNFVFKDASPFAAALLIPSMKLGEDLIIDPPISEQLFNNMHRIMNIFLEWNIGLKPIKIHAGILLKDIQENNSVASFFSGGVDSFYTYLKNTKGEDGGIKYFILVNGYDIELKNNKLWMATLANIKKIAKEGKIEIIEVESNIHSLIEPIVIWDYTHGGCLAAVALCLRNKLKKVYIASSLTNEQHFPWGSTKETDEYWGTEKLSIINDGGEASRLEKIKYIVSSPLTDKYLRVCYMNKKDTYNCGSCEKCLRTMIHLLITGALNKSKTFPHTIDTDLVARLKLHKNSHLDNHYRDSLMVLEKMKIEPKLQEAIKICLANKTNDYSLFNNIRSLIAFYDYVYNKSRITDRLGAVRTIFSS